MIPEFWPECDSAADDIAALLDDLLRCKAAKRLRDRLAELRETLGKDFSPQLQMQIEFGILDEYRLDRDELVLLSSELSASANDEIKLDHSGSMPQKYIVGGAIQIVPDDRCPSCWGRWGMKLIQPICPGCGATLGVDVKHVLDADICPCCAEESISPAKLTCDKCHVAFGSSWFVWSSAEEPVVAQ